MLELTKISLRRDKINWRDRWFVDEHQGQALVNLFNSDSKDECLEFMRRYRETCD